MTINDASWQEQSSCPGCSQTQPQRMGSLPDKVAMFIDETITYPPCKITVFYCQNCQLAYKSPVLPEKEISQLFQKYENDAWTNDYAYKDEIKCIASLTSNRPFDILDIGAAHGDFLSIINTLGGRRSALDLYQSPKLSARISGEFIKGTLDKLKWKGHSYDIVTLFDVFEHLYDLNLAFVNLTRLVKAGGYVIIETGNAHSMLPSRYGLHHWWYLRLIEHHVAATPHTFQVLAQRHGFTILSSQSKRHKNRILGFSKLLIKELIHACIYRLSRRIFTLLLKQKGKQPRQPYAPLAHDHMRVILRKNDKKQNF